MIYRFISRDDLDVNAKFETLMAGGCIREKITENLTYDTLTSTERNLWSLLYMTGYLTRGTPAQEEPELEQDEVILRIPNEEVKSLFKTAIVEWFQDSVRNADRQRMFDALWCGKTEQAGEIISDTLFDTISYPDYQESFYHAFLAGVFTGAVCGRDREGLSKYYLLWNCVL